MGSPPRQIAERSTAFLISSATANGFDQRNQLVWAKHSDTDGGAVDLQVDFKYDAFGNRIEKAHDADGAGGGSAVVTRFALDGWKNVRQPLVGNENWDVWADLDGSSSLTTRYVRGDVIDQLFARIEEDAGGDIPYWYLTDHPGSIRDVIDGSAAVKNAITYDGFGNITAETDTNYRGRYAWTGREIDAEIELQYNRARYYDAKTGRWISQDLLGFDTGDSNLYRYVENSPVLGVDPSGLLLEHSLYNPNTGFKARITVEGLNANVFTGETGQYTESDYENWGQDGIRISVYGINDWFKIRMHIGHVKIFQIVRSELIY
jgi:RHS repeat-associated protein